MRTPPAYLGVTLIELLFSVALLAVLAGLAAPGFRSSLRASAVRSASFELLAGLQQARAHSILQSRPGLLCPADASGNCLPTGATATGWRSFLEAGPGREILAGRELPRGVVLRATRSPIRFWPASFAASTGTLTICDLQRLAPARAIVISQGGRARLAPGAEDACGA
jgi:type IV fimbrial biogenesis protein FimT